MLKDGLEKVSSLTTESLHLALITKVLDKERNAELFYSEEQALTLLGRKLSTYESHLSFDILRNQQDVSIASEEGDIKLSTDGLEKMFWSVFALNEVLEERYPWHDSFVSRWHDLEKSLREVFYEMRFSKKEETEFDAYWSHLFMPFLNNEEHRDALLQKESKKFASFNDLLSLDAKDTIK